jgi:phage host-nuclease inhibitor protein Gam
MHSPVKVDEKGKLIVDRSKVSNYREEGNTKTITYKTDSGYMGQGEVIKKIQVKEVDGVITHITRIEDREAVKKLHEQYNKKNGLPFKFIKQFDTTFEHSDTGCKIANTEYKLEVDGKDEVKVSYDKKLCDDIAPQINQMGKQNALQCGGLFSKIEESFKARNKELLKNGKELTINTMGGVVGVDFDFGSKSRDWTMMSILNNCMMAENPVLPGLGYGSGFGGGYGGGGNLGPSFGPILEFGGAVGY